MPGTCSARVEGYWGGRSCERRAWSWTGALACWCLCSPALGAWLSLSLWGGRLVSACVVCSPVVVDSMMYKVLGSRNVKILLWQTGPWPRSAWVSGGLDAACDAAAYGIKAGLPQSGPLTFS